MKPTKGAMGRPSWRASFLAHPDAKFFCEKRGLSSLGEKEHGAGSRGEIFSFGFFSLQKSCAAARSRQGRAVFWRGGSAPLTARTAAEPSAREEKILSRTVDFT